MFRLSVAMIVFVTSVLLTSTVRNNVLFVFITICIFVFIWYTNVQLFIISTKYFSKNAQKVKSMNNNDNLKQS